MNTLKLPLVYAVTVGLIFATSRPHSDADPLTKAIDLASGAAVPTMLVILGIELAHAKIEADAP